MCREAVGNRKTLFEYYYTLLILHSEFPEFSTYSDEIKFSNNLIYNTSPLRLLQCIPTPFRRDWSRQGLKTCFLSHPFINTT